MNAMTARQAKLHPATVRCIADWMENQVQTLIDSFSEPDGRITPKNVADEVKKVQGWIAKLRASMNGERPL